MRLSVLPAILVSAVIGLAVGSCDLLDNSVLLDEGAKTIKNDSTTIRVMSSLPDSTRLVINTGSSWEASIRTGDSWCTLSKYSGPAGVDTIYVRVGENTGTSARQTWLVVESGNMIMRFKVMQTAAEAWHDTPYWNRTAAQRLGLHGKVSKITVTDNRHSTESSIYSFDERGNLLSNQSIDKVANRYDTTRTFTYDDANHRITCTVTEDAGNTVVRTWSYEYNNPGRYVAFSATGWLDTNPLAEDMRGMIVPDLSASHKIWKDSLLECHEDKRFVFESDSRLLIITDRWQLEDTVRTNLGCDTMKVSYNYYSRMLLPSTSRGYVTNCSYYSNGMLKMMQTSTGAYDYVENQQCMLVASYSYTGPMDEPHSYDSYECDYNVNHDLVERRLRDSRGVTTEKYPQYQYDDQHNWTARMEEVIKPGFTEGVQNATKREILYYK